MYRFGDDLFKILTAIIILRATITKKYQISYMCIKLEILIKYIKNHLSLFTIDNYIAWLPSFVVPY